MLRRASAAGFFAAPGKLRMLENDTDFQPLFPRSDFQELMRVLKPGN
jgi:hypothetical protein